MRARLKTDRRKKGTQGFSHGRPGLLQLPTPLALLVLGFATLLTVAADRAFAHEVWLGPIYLLISALAAWMVSSRLAILLGLIVISFNLIVGNQIIDGNSQNYVALNVALRVFCLLVVILLLGSARKSLEREWRLARIDPLTGALNRQAFFEGIAADAGPEGPALLIFADVDGLKRVNDEIGHEAGDKCLQNFADRVRMAIRKDDLFARLGGDEFAIFMKVRDETASRAVANRLNKVLNLDSSSQKDTLKCSLGALFLPAGSTSIDAELRLADKLMYSAKRAQAGVSMALPALVDGHMSLSMSTETDQQTGRHTVTRSTSRKLGHIEPSENPLAETKAA